MKNRKYASKMVHVYGHIYSDFYKRSNAQVKEALFIIKKNLRESQVALSDLYSMNVLNVGTGREAYVFQVLGAREVYHFDISTKSVRSLKALIRSDRKFSNITTRQLDICYKGISICGTGIDFVYLSGVLHHLYDPDQALKNILKVLNPGAKCFFRIYRSGSLAFFVVDYIRKFITFADKKTVRRVFWSLHDETNADHVQLYRDIYDDFFVPTLRLIDPGQMDEYFSSYGFRSLYHSRETSYDHQSTAADSQGVSLAYQLKDRALLLKQLGNRNAPKFPPHTDQLRDIRYKDSDLQSLVAKLSACVNKIKRLPSGKKAEFAVRLYALSQLYRSRQRVTSRQKWSQINGLLTRFSCGGASRKRKA